MRVPTYIDAIATNWPTVQAYCEGDGTDYDSLIVESGPALPAKPDLDAWISDRIKALKWDEIKAERDRRKVSGVKVGANWFHSDDASRIQQLGLVMFGAGLPANVQWKTLTGAFVTMTPTLAQQIFGAVAASDMAIFTVAETHKAAMLASADPKNYDFSAGWPQEYQP